MRKMVLGFLGLIGFLGNAQQLLEVLKPHTNSFVPSDKCLERVKDKYYGDGVHNFIYCAVMGPNGKKWLNLNLGAEYAREDSEHFNPEAVPTDYNDWKIFGSSFQYGRDADGHELVTYQIIKAPRTQYSYWIVDRLNGTIVGDSRNYPSPHYWENWYYESGKERLWAYEMPRLNMNPCPAGYRVISPNDVRDFISDGIIKRESGNDVTVAVFSSSKFPNLMLYTAPIGIDKRHHYYESIRTPVELDADIGGSSCQWLLATPDQPSELWLYDQIDNSIKKYYTVKNKDFVVLDNGMYTRVPPFMIGAVESFHRWGEFNQTFAVRCTEK